MTNSRIKSLHLQNREVHNGLKTNLQPQVLKELNRLTILLLHE